jgi:voltage-gated potassium channel
MYKKKTELVVAALTVSSLAIILLDYLFDFSAIQKLFIYTFDLIVVILLAIDFYGRFLSSNKRFKFLANHWYEIPAMIPLVGYAGFGTHVAVGMILRSLRLLTFFRLIRLFRIVRYFGESEFIFIASFTAVTIIFGAIAMYLVEAPNDQANIRSIADAFWWSVGTATTVAYGDVYPITADGKIIATILMFASIGIIGAFISTLGAKLIGLRLGKEDNQQQQSRLTQETKETIKNKIDKIESLNQNEVDLLVNMIKSLYDTLENQSQSRVSPLSTICSRCSKNNPNNALFCNHCGLQLMA